MDGFSRYQMPFISPLDPVLNALHQLLQYDSVSMLQPKSPLRTTDDVDGCLDLVAQGKAPSVVSVTNGCIHPYWIFLNSEVDTQFEHKLVEFPLKVQL